MGIDITKDLRKYLPKFQEAHDQAMNESDTSLRVSKFCEDVLGYDVFSEVSREHAVKERNVDYAIKCGGKLQFFIEVKQAGLALKEKHIEQASNYAANAGVINRLIIMMTYTYRLVYSGIYENNGCPET